MNKKELLLLSIGVFMTVIAWLVADIYHAATEEKIKVRTQIPTLKKYHVDEQLLKNLKEKTE